MNTESKDQDFKKNIQKNVLQIRKKNREDIFMKKRFMNQQDQMDQQTKRQRQKIIIDQRYRDVIVKALDKIYTHEKVEDYISNLNNPSPIIRHQAIIGARKIIAQSLNEQKIQRYIDLGSVGIVIELIKDYNFPQIQLEGLWILTNIASGTSVQCRSIIDKNGIELFFDILQSKNNILMEQAIWCLGNISGDCIKYRDLIISKNCLGRLIKIAQNTTNRNLLRYTAWAIANITRGKPLPKYEFIKDGIVTLCKILLTTNLQQQQLCDSIWAISYNSQGQKTKIQKIIQVNGFVPYLIKLCSQVQPNNIMVPALRILGNISTGNQLQTQQILKHGALALFNNLLDNNKKFIRRQTCWIISNICGGIASQVLMVIQNQQLMTKIIRLFDDDQIDIKKQICFIFSNMVYHGPPQIVLKTYLCPEVIQGVVSCINQDEDAIGIKSGLQCSNIQPNPIYRYLQEQMGFFQRLQSLQHHLNSEIYKLITKIFKQFFQILNQSHSL